MSLKLNETGPSVHLNASDFSDLVHPLNKTGLALDSVITYVNFGIDLGVNESLPESSFNAVLQYGTAVIGVILQVCALSKSSVLETRY